MLDSSVTVRFLEPPEVEATLVATGRMCVMVDDELSLTGSSENLRAMAHSMLRAIDNETRVPGHHADARRSLDEDTARADEEEARLELIEH